MFSIDLNHLPINKTNPYTSMTRSIDEGLIFYSFIIVCILVIAVCNWFKLLFVHNIGYLWFNAILNKQQ